MKLLSVVVITITVGIPKSQSLVPLSNGIPLKAKLVQYRTMLIIKRVLIFNRLGKFGGCKAILLNIIPPPKNITIRQPKKINKLELIGGKISDQPNEYKNKHKAHAIANARYGLDIVFNLNFI